MKKKRKKRNFGIRYRRYQILFAVLFGTFFLSFLLEWFLWGSGNWQSSEMREGILSLLLPLFLYEGAVYLVTFLSGITVYAPAAAVFVSAGRGMLSSFVLASLFPAESGRDYGLAVLFLFFSVASAWLYSGYSGFCASVSLRLFWDGIRKDPREEEKMFGGVMFNSSLFCNTVNFRFLFSYCTVFFSALALEFFLLFLYALLRSLIV